LLKYSWGVVGAKEGENDGMVSVESAKWGMYLGTVPASHAEINGRRKSKDGRFCPQKLFLEFADLLYEHGF
jgi:hypothetical protein